MSRDPQILIQQLMYALPNGNVVLNQLDFSFLSNKTGIVGKNGVGKSTLLKLIIGDLLPNSGSIAVTGKLAYCPQENTIFSYKTVADVLGIAAKLSALNRIMQGEYTHDDLILLNDDWNIQERTRQQLAEFGLSTILLEQPVKNLSGGELTRLHLAKVFLANADFILLDEPTNNLDIEARKSLYSAIEKWPYGLIIVSHDRRLLNLMDQIVEITAIGVNAYGGNFDSFQDQKAIEHAARAQQLQDAEKMFQKVRGSIQSSREKHEKRKSQGVNLRRSGKIDKMAADAAKGRSERSQHMMPIKEERMRAEAVSELKSAKDKIEISQEIKIPLPDTYVPNDKMMVEMEDVIYCYPHQTRPIINNFNLKIQGPERIGIVGKNGSGKTTLVKLILNDLKPLAGHIYLGTNRVSYLEQNLKSLNLDLTILENFKILNPDIGETDSRLFLAQFLFRNTAALKLVKNLSGGEKLRAMLACVLMSKQPPQLLILDEPTNHLDLNSIETIESALQSYEGALLIISHDEQFLENIKIERIVKM